MALSPSVDQSCNNDLVLDPPKSKWVPRSVTYISMPARMKSSPKERQTASHRDFTKYRSLSAKFNVFTDEYQNLRFWKDLSLLLVQSSNIELGLDPPKSRRVPRRITGVSMPARAKGSPKPKQTRPWNISAHLQVILTFTDGFVWCQRVEDP